jgi:hypothetical protein
MTLLPPANDSKIKDQPAPVIRDFWAAPFNGEEIEAGPLP